MAMKVYVEYDQNKVVLGYMFSAEQNYAGVLAEPSMHGEVLDIWQGLSDLTAFKSKITGPVTKTWQVKKIKDGKEVLETETWTGYELDNSGDFLPVKSESEEADMALRDAQASLAEAKAFLSDTDYVITKISEASALGEDTSALKIKYSNVLARRATVRSSINGLEDTVSAKSSACEAVRARIEAMKVKAK